MRIGTVAIIMSVGLAVDYTMHVGCAFAESALPSREARLRQTIMEMGPTIGFAFLSSFSSGLTMTMCRIGVLHQLGVLFATAIAASACFAMFWFLPALSRPIECRSASRRGQTRKASASSNGGRRLRAGTTVARTTVSADDLGTSGPHFI